MIEVVLITALSVDGLIALAAVLGFIAVKTGMLEGSVTLRAVPPKKRELERAAEAEGAAQARGTP